MNHPPVIQRVAVIATGVIGASWAAHFLAHGLDVSATDPSPGAEERLRASVAQHWPTLERLGLKPGASQGRRIRRLRNLLFSSRETFDFVLAGIDLLEFNVRPLEDSRICCHRATDRLGRTPATRQRTTHCC